MERFFIKESCEEYWSENEAIEKHTKTYKNILVNYGRGWSYLLPVL
jgi:hypothetical protein